MASTIIRAASVFDGSGAPPICADVAVEGDRIAAIAPRLSESAADVIQADGLALAPGFIDIHSHTDLTVFQYPLAESKICQGVTVEVTGNCGIGAFPVRPERRQMLSEYLHLHGAHLPSGGLTWNTFSEYAEVLDGVGLGLNLVPLTAHAALRMAAFGSDDRPPTASEHAAMRRLLAECLDQGAWGMSTGLIYPPGSFAEAEELIDLARVLAQRGKIYTSHIRGEGATLRPALAEAVRVAREGGARVQVSHLKALGQANWGQGVQALATLEEARAAGLDVAADQYPYEATSTTLSAIVPAWAHAGGVDRLVERLGAPDLADRLRGEMGTLIAARGGPARIVIAGVGSGANRRVSGKSLAQLSGEWTVAPEEAARRLLREERGAVGAVYFSLSDEDVSAIMGCPWVAVGSDGQGVSAVASAESLHPRSYGTFPRVLGHYVRERRVLTLAQAIRKMTSLPAERLGLRDRGRLRPGFAADLVLFDPATVRDRATFEHPHQYPEGIVHVFVNGRAVVRDGRITGEAPGRVLRSRDA